VVHLRAAIAGQRSFEGVGAEDAELAGHKDSARGEFTPVHPKRAALHVAVVVFPASVRQAYL
jgi:hypothetical protein